MILYLHGFASSCNSEKVKALADFPHVKVVSFDLSMHPLEAVRQIETFIKENQSEDIMLMGSSLGGYYAQYISTRFDLPAVLVNPSMQPYNTLARFVGLVTKNFSKDETFIYTQQDIDELKQLNIDQVDQSKVLLMLQKGDADLDYKIAVEALPHAQHHIEEGGNHSFQNFASTFSLIETFYRSFYKAEKLSNTVTLM